MEYHYQLQISSKTNQNCYYQSLFSFHWPYFWHRFSQTTSIHSQPPPPYQPPQPYSLHATVAQPFGFQQQQNQCPIHRLQQCTCMLQNNTREVWNPSRSVSPKSNLSILSNTYLEHVTCVWNRNVSVISTQWTIAGLCHAGGGPCNTTNAFCQSSIDAQHRMQYGHCDITER